MLITAINSRHIIGSPNNLISASLVKVGWLIAAIFFIYLESYIVKVPLTYKSFALI